MRNKKIVSALLISTLCVGLLSGCANPFERITAEKLIASAFPQDTNSIEYKVLQDFTAETAIENVLTEMSVNSNTDVKINENFSVTDSTISIKTADEQEEMVFKTYNDYKNYVSYSYDSESNTWESEKITANNELDTLKFPTSEIFSNLVLDKKTSGEEYIVTGKMSSDYLSKFGSSLIPIIEDFGTDLNDNEMTFNVAMRFDKETKSIKTLTLSLNEKIETDEIKLTKFDIVINYIKFNDIDIAIPADVKNENNKADSAVTSTPIKLDESQTSVSSEKIEKEEIKEKETETITENKKEYAIGSYTIEKIRSIVPISIASAYTDEELYNELIKNIQEIRNLAPDDTKDLSDEEVLEVLFVMSGYMDENGKVIPASEMNVDDDEENIISSGEEVLIINDVKVKLPMTVKEFKKLGFDVADTKDWDNNPSGPYASAPVYFKDSKNNTICTSVTKNDNVPFEDSKLEYINVKSTDFSGTASLGKITFGDTADKIKTTYGTPFDEFDTGKSACFDYKFATGTKASFWLDNNALTQITISNYK